MYYKLYKNVIFNKNFCLKLKVIMMLGVNVIKDCYNVEFDGFEVFWVEVLYIKVFCVYY